MLYLVYYINIKKALWKDSQKSIKYTQFLNDLAFYHNTNILKHVNYITSRKWSIERFELWKQEEILSLHLQELENRKILDIDNDIIYIDKNNELIYKDEIYKLHYILGWDEIIYKLWKWYINVSNLSYERKIPFVDLIKEWSKKFLLYNDSFFEENWYIYIHISMKHFFEYIEITEFIKVTLKNMVMILMMLYFSDFRMQKIM